MLHGKPQSAKEARWRNGCDGRADLSPGEFSRPSLLPHWDGDIYTRVAARFYHPVTVLTGWQRMLRRNAIDSLPIGRTLDLGCGTGLLLKLLLENGHKAIGVDPSTGMLQKARALFQLPEEVLVVGSATALPFPDCSFDTVIASGSLVHIESIEIAALEITRVLRPGGMLRIIDHAVPVDRSWWTPALTVFSQLSGDILHDYPELFRGDFELLSQTTLGRGGYLQQFDFSRSGAESDRSRSVS